MNSENVVGAILRANNDNTVTRPSGDGLPVGLSLACGDGARFTPFGCGDTRTLAITADDERWITGNPAPLRALVPVTIES